MRRFFAVSTLAGLLALPAHAAPAPQESWGKAGVSLAQYRQDSVECGLKGHYTDVSNTQDAQVLINASRQLDTIQGTFAPNTTGASPSGPPPSDANQIGQYAATQQHIVDNARPELRYRNIKHTLEATTADCLMQRGYSKFTLTDEQRRALRKLKPGSDQRRAYLHALASDPLVLQIQKAATPRP
ncbi:hypothetical protein [Sphingomonas sp.]|uniref:hypothetical protein n=1 Tax=Sphingomonas sp. TaxID=28214 RepID=UPI0038A8EE66